MSTTIFIFDIVLIIIFACSCTINVTAYCKTKHVREFETGMLMFFYCLNSMIIFMSEFLLKLPLFEGAYNVLTYFSVKVICGIAISTLYMLLTASLLEKKMGILHVIIMMPLICVTVYVGDLNGSVSQHWVFYTIRQIYLACFVLYYFIRYASAKDREYKIRIREYRFIFVIGGIFSVLIFAEDSMVIFHFQYVINTLNLKVFMEHNLSEDIFFVILAATGVKSGFSQLIQRREPAGKIELGTAFSAAAVCEVKTPYPEDPFVSSFGLSNRQRDVLYLLLKDRTYQEMGEELGLSVGTVKFHAHGIYEKTDSRNRSELIDKYKKFYESREQTPLT
nr:helix-turn-helix transcriptional regulator [uncultured Clostridium sp.]